MKIIVGSLVAFLLGSAMISNMAEAGCYNHCGSYHHVSYRGGYHHHGYYHHGWYR